jgi:hypothetical protein
MKNTWNLIEADHKKVKEFGFVIFIVLAIIIPLFSAFKHDWSLTNFAMTTTSIGIALVLFTTFLTKIMFPVYKAWMLLAIGLGFVMTRVIITFVYLLMITPVGIIRRIKGNNVSDTFSKFKSSNKESYWIQRTDEYDPTSTEKQY